MTHSLTDYGIYTVNGKAIQDLDIQLRLMDLNYATFVHPISITLGTQITIKYQNVRDVFVGVVTQCRKLARTVNGVTRYSIECVEPAEELTNKYILNLAENYTALYINNTSEDKSLGEFVGYITNGSGWEDISDPTYKTQTTVTSGASNGAIPGMGFATCTIWTALQRLVVDVFNYGIWFSYPVGRKCLKYGEYNNDVTSIDYPTPINITLTSNNVNYSVDGVIVYNDDSSLMAYSGDISLGNKIVAYRYSQCQSTDELQWVADRVFADRSVPNTRYEIEFPAGYFTIFEGDRIHIYDTSVGLVYNADGYGVKDVRIMSDKTTVGIGSAKLTIFDVLDDRLSLIDGDSAVYSAKEIDTGWYNVLNDAGSDPDTWGVTTEVPFTIDGQTFMGGLLMMPFFSGSQIDGAGYFRVYSAAGYSEQVITVTPASPLTANASGVFLDEWFPWTWQWAEVEVSYMVNISNTTGHKCNWTCVWDGTTVMDRGGITPVSSVQRTVTHKWYVPTYTSNTKSYPVLTCTTTDEDFIMNDITVFVTVYYEAGDEYPSIDTTMSSGQIDMNIDNDSWFTIYDSSDAEAYTNKEYNMKDYISSYTTFATGEHTIYLRLKGAGDAAVRIIGSYASFNEKTKVIS